MYLFLAFWLYCFLMPNSGEGKGLEPLFARAHREISEWLRRYIVAEKERLASIRRRLEVFEAAVKAAEGVDPEEYLGLPMNAFLLIKRLTKDYQEILEIAKDDTNSRLLLDMTPGGRRGRRYRFPTRKDILKATVDLLHFQKERGLNATAVSDGVGTNVTTMTVRLTARDCYEVSLGAKELGYMAKAKEWMNEAIKRSVDGTLDPILGKEYLAIFAYEERNIPEAIALTRQIQELAPDHARAVLNMELYEEALKQLYVDHVTPARDDYVKFMKETVSLQPPCLRTSYLHSGAFPVIIYRETIRRDPPTFLYGDILSLRELSLLKESVLSEEADVRTKDANDCDNLTLTRSVLRKLSERIEGVTGLTVSDTEAPWTAMRFNCDRTVWLSQGHNLKKKPLATWWTFLTYGAHGPEDEVAGGTSVLRYHVKQDGTRDAEMLKHKCRQPGFILAKRIMLEDQPPFYLPQVRSSLLPSLDSLLQVPRFAWNMTIGLVT